MEDSETLLFSPEDIKSGGNSYIFRKLESHPQLKELSIALKKALKCNNIEELLPLEEAIIPDTQRIGGHIRGKWNIPQPQQPKQEFVPDTANTRAKWNKA